MIGSIGFCNYAITVVASSNTPNESNSWAISYFISFIVDSIMVPLIKNSTGAYLYLTVIIIFD